MPHSPQGMSSRSRLPMSERLASIIATQNDLIASDLDAAAVQHLIAAKAQRLTGALGAVVERVEAEELVYRAAAGHLAHTLGLRLPLRGSLSGLCVTSGEVLVCEDSEEDPRVHREACRRLGVRSMVVVPLRHGGRSVGVLKVMADTPRGFTSEDVDTLQLVAGIASAALTRSAVAEERALLAERADLAERMAAVGRLAAGVAHEANNPLAFTISSLSFLDEFLRLSPEERTPGELHEAREALAQAREGAERVRCIVKELHAFAHAESEAPAPLRLEDVAERALALAAHQLRHGVHLERDLQPTPAVMGRRAPLCQLALNLLINAAQAMPPGRAPGASRLRVATGTAPDGRAFLEVQDSGVGIAPEVLPRIFEPFYTTRDQGQGVGLGLFSGHNIAVAHGGELCARSTPGQGSTFRLLLPAA